MTAYPATFHREDDGRYAVEFIDFDGCNTCGDNLSEAKLMAGDALDGILKVMRKYGDEIPAPSHVGDNVSGDEVCYIEPKFYIAPRITGATRLLALPR